MYLKRIRIIILFKERYLNNKISEEMKNEVIRLYLQGKSRNDIARTCGLGEGTVSNIIDEWKHSLEIPDVQSLRDLAVNLKRCGIDAVQCAQGLRTLNIMKKLGINQNQFESFMREVYQYCQGIGLAPQDIASNLQALINLSKGIPFSKIPEHIEEKKKEKIQLEEDIKTLKKRKDDLEMETSLAKELRDAALEKERTTVAELKEYSNLKTELRKYDIILIEDLPKLVQLLYGIRQHGYDAEKVLSEYQDLLFIKENHDIFCRQISELKEEKMRLQNERYFLKAEISRHSQRLYTYDELESKGIGIKELKIFCNAINEIAAENGISYRVAIEQLFGYLQEEYGIKIRQLQHMRPSVSYSYRTINTKSKTPEEEEERNNQSDNDNNNHDGDIYDR
jgi:hypothetical protein